MPDALKSASEYRGDIQQRLKSLLGDLSQAEVARKTATSRQNVSRYARGTRIPIEFASALGGGLGINPVWLLLGEGTPYLADLSATNKNMAGDLLELVAAMNTVARMRIGSLTGKDHLKVLRELNDSLRDYERLRARMNEYAHPIFRQLLQGLRVALTNFERGRADGLRQAARQVSTLCADEELNLEFASLEAYYENAYHARDESALQAQRRVFLRAIPAKGLAGSRSAQETIKLAAAYMLRDRYREARAVAAAGVELARASDDTMSLVAQQLEFRGLAEISLGRLAKGTRSLQDALPGLSPRHRAVAMARMLYARLLSGAQDPADSVHEAAVDKMRAGYLLRMACWREDATLIRAVMEKFAAIQDETPTPASLVEYRYAPVLLAAVADRGKGALRMYHKTFGQDLAGEAHSPRDAVRYHAFGAQVAWLCGDHAAARRFTQDAQKEHNALQAGVGIDQLINATHFRNILRLGGKASQWARMANQAHKFFAALKRSGHHGLLAHAK